MTHFIYTMSHRYDSIFGFENKKPELLLYLRKVNWMDEHTKAVVVSINIINGDSGFSTIIEHVYEFTLGRSLQLKFENKNLLFIDIILSLCFSQCCPRNYYLSQEKNKSLPSIVRNNVCYFQVLFSSPLSHSNLIALNTALVFC